MPSFTIKTYELRLTNRASPYAWIMLYDSEDAGEAGHRARLNFVPMKETSYCTSSESGGLLSVRMPYAVFPSVVDLLRNEKPLHITWSSPDGFVIVSSTEEPVGEEELESVP